MEKKKLYSGDKSILYSRLQLNTDEDVETLKEQLKYEKKLLAKETKHYHKKFQTQRRIDNLKAQIAFNEQSKDERADITLSSDEEKQKQIMNEIIKGEEMAFTPIIIKASTAGALETVMKESNKILLNCQNAAIMETGIGPFTEADISNAQYSNAILMGFDLPMNETLEKKLASSKVIAKVHKLIFKFTENLQQLIDDVNQAAGTSKGVEVVGTAIVQAIFDIELKGDTKRIAGLNVKSGEIF